MIDWINEKYGTKFTDEQLTNVKNFSLLWNIFENVICKNHCNVEILNQVLTPIHFDNASFHESFDYFKNRYISDGVTNERFNQLDFRKGDRKDLVAKVLLENDKDSVNMVLALSIIIYRYRNNLFHGLKDFMQIDGQEENFRNANRVLKNILMHF